MEKDKSGLECWSIRRTQSTTLNLKMEKRVHEPKNGQFRIWRIQGNRFAPWTSRMAHSPDGVFILVQWDPCYLPDLQNYTVTHLFVVQFSRSVVSDSLRPHELQHARPPCSSPTPGGHPNSCASSRWCHPAISSSGVPFSSCPQSLPAPGSFPMSQFFAWGGQSIGVSVSASVLPMNTQDWSPLGWCIFVLYLIKYRD